MIRRTKLWKNNLPLDKYLKDISKHKVLKAEEEVLLIQKIRSGDRKAFHKMVESNLKFVVKVAKEYIGQGLPLEDLINEGNLGLIKAVEKFDETKGFKFISYAVWWIRQSIMQALSEQSRIIRLPGNKLSDLSKISKAAKDFEAQFHRIPSNEELASMLDISIDNIITANEIGSRSLSLDSPVGYGEEVGYLIDLIADDSESLPDKLVMDESLKDQIKASLKILNEKERNIVILYFGIDRESCLTLEDIGDMLRLTRERVRQIKEKALRKLKNSSKVKEALYR